MNRLGLHLALLPGLIVVLTGVSRPATAQSTRPRVAVPGAAEFSAFHERVDLDALGRIAVHRDGRVKAFESLARELMSLVTGPRPYEGLPPTVMYLDLMLRPEAYADAAVIYVKSKLIRAQMVTALRSSMDEQLATLPGSTGQAPAVRARLEEALERFVETGLVSEPMLMDPNVQDLLARLETDLLRSARYVRMLETALTVKSPAVLADTLRVVPPGGDSFDAPWQTLDEIAGTPGDVPQGERLVRSWRALRTAWVAGDVDGVNTAAADLAAMLPGVNPGLYPATNRLGWESWYFRMHNLTWIWIVYALALVPLLLSVVFRWRGAHWSGMILFVAAFGLQTFAVMLRWYVAERFPNTNMFEAVTTAAWFGGCFALILEIALRRTPVRSLLALGSGVASMAALMAAHFLPLQLNAGIGNRMPVLHDVWLYIHTNVIIFSYCLIFIAAVSALLYLAYRVAGRLRGRGGAREHARVGGAGSLIMTTPEGGPCLAGEKASIGQVLDGTTMIVLELAFIMLWAGLVMGAIWADHSWGRPWGWDPKEVFALNTFIIFVLLIHTRLKVRDKGLWTAWLAIAGCVVMLFNWIVINFTISGLHSYA